MFGTSSFGTAVTSAPNCELRHQIVSFGTKFDWNVNFGTMKKQCAEVHLCRSSFTRQTVWFRNEARKYNSTDRSFIENILRDFNHEEKGEEIDDLEPKMEEKEKVTKPRGWNKESVGKDDQQKPKKENPKKKKSQNLEKNEKSGKNPKLPTADGSR